MLFFHISHQQRATMSLARRSFDQQAYIPISIAIADDGVMLSSTTTQCSRDRGCRGQEGSKPIVPINQCRDNDAERLRTVECLRGRLQAERVASKEAKEVTQVIGKKLEDLEKKLNEEISSRNKAEKRLRNALKKLKKIDSFKILDLPDSSVGSFSSSHSSSTANEGFNDKTSGSVKTDNDSSQFSSFEEVKEEKNAVGASENESWCSIGSELSRVNDGNCGDQSSENCGSEEEFHADMRQSPVSTAVQETPNQQPTKQEETNLAIVPSNPKTSKEEHIIKPEIKEKNVHAVLLALRQVREQLQCSIERRSSISSVKELCGH